MSSKVHRAGRRRRRPSRWSGARCTPADRSRPTEPAASRADAAAAIGAAAAAGASRRAREAHAAGFAGRRGRRAAARGRGTAAGHRAPGAQPSRNSAALRARLRARGGSRPGAAGAGHRPARPAPRTGGRSRRPARPGAGGARKTARRRRSRACASIPRTPPLVTRLPASRAVAGAPIEVVAGSARASRGTAIFETERGNLDASVDSQLAGDRARPGRPPAEAVMTNASRWPPIFAELDRIDAVALDRRGDRSGRPAGRIARARSVAIGDFCEIRTAGGRAHPHPGDRFPQRPRALHAARRDRRPATGRPGRGAQRGRPRGSGPGPARPRASTASASPWTAGPPSRPRTPTTCTARRPARSTASTSPSRWSPASAPSTACCPAAKGSASASSAAAAWARARCSAPCRATTRPTSRVIALIGERNREVRGFLEHELGPEGRKRSVVVVRHLATGRRRCACAPASWPWPSPSISATRAPTCCW